MIDWVHDALKDWGRAKYWVLFGRGGYPTRTMLGKLMEEGVVGASCSSLTMEYPEVLVGENLKTENAVKTLPETPRNIITAHYVFRLPVKLKCAKLEIPKTTYYQLLSHAHINIANALDKMGRNRADITSAQR